MRRISTWIWDSFLALKATGTAANIALAAAAILVCLAVAEIALRTFSSIGPRSGHFEPETAFENELTPRTAVFAANYSGVLTSRDFEIPYELNSLGFRERELDFKELSRNRPYLFTGDSYFHGWGVERDARISERFAAILQSDSVEAEVLNLAFPGFGTYQYLDILKLYAEKINPRLVIIGFFIGNDFLDDIATTKRGRRSDRQDEKFLQLYTHDIKALLRAFLRSSPLVNMARYSLWEIEFFRYFFAKLSIENDRIILYKREDSLLQDTFYSATFAAFEEIAKFAQRREFSLLVVLVPDHLQILKPELFAQYDFDKPQKKLTRHLEKLGIPHLDLSSEFLFFERPQELYFREDKHWTAKGHEFAADLLFKYVQAEKN